MAALSKDAQRIETLEGSKSRDNAKGKAYMRSVAQSGTAVGVSILSGILYELVPQLESFEIGDNGFAIRPGLILGVAGIIGGIAMATTKGYGGAIVGGGGLGFACPEGQRFGRTLFAT